MELVKLSAQYITKKGHLHTKIIPQGQKVGGGTIIAFESKNTNEEVSSSTRCLFGIVIKIHNNHL